MVSYVLIRLYGSCACLGNLTRSRGDSDPSQSYACCVSESEFEWLIDCASDCLGKLDEFFFSQVSCQTTVLNLYLCPFFGCSPLCVYSLWRRLYVEKRKLCFDHVAKEVVVRSGSLELTGFAVSISNAGVSWVDDLLVVPTQMQE